MATYEAAGPAQIQTPSVEWRDTKRYAWLLGAVIPMVPVMAWGLVELTGLDAFWFFGPLFVFGVIPLMLASGPGQEMRQALGTAVFFGMLGVTLFGLIFTPVFYVVTRWISDRLPGRKPKAVTEAEAPQLLGH